ncbi:sensor histidine kinase [Lacisediminihabitans sp.]|jgi:signal transduction histidine kinase|uniref:sensor histidine kinase n=1 Tax=Lacisediminihabitans sp. TaxID=2787631 RepID=UPI002F942C43
MTGNRWWHALFGATMLVLVALAVTGWAPDAGHRVLALVTIAVMAACYLAFGRLGYDDPRFGLPFTAVMIVGSGVVVACSPNLAVIQAIAFPVVWRMATSVRAAIVANLLLALAVGAGYVSVLGAIADVYVEAFMIEGISIVGSIALGLWISRITSLSRERQLLLDELTATQEQLSALHRDLGVTSERERLAREIHDTIAQSLTGLVMLSQRAQRELAAGNLSPLAGQLGALEETAREGLIEARSLVASTAPVELGGGIAPALERLAARFGRETGVTVTVDAEGRTELDRDTEVVLLRSAQEALANVRKHSGARSATLGLGAADGTVVLTVRDDGTGFDPSAPTTGFGLPGMRDRLALVNGALQVTSAPGEGTTLRVSLPAVTP